MNDCYKFQLRKFRTGFFDSFVDMTYIITMVGSNLMNHLEKQLKKYVPTKNIYIVYNKGYKNCNKKLRLYIPPYDITHAYFTVIEHSIRHNYNNILILEDDFIFDNNIFDINVRYNIDNFLKRSYNNEYIYYFGCIPYLQIKTFNYHNLLLLSTGTHACIYPKKFINNIIKINQKKIIDWDIFLNLNYKRYCYYKPICYQLFPETENKKSWNNTLYLSYFIKYLLLVLKLDKKIEPGYTIMYNFSILFFYILLLILVILIYIIKFKMY
jgi:hypothetical protein